MKTIINKIGRIISGIVIGSSILAGAINIGNYENGRNHLQFAMDNHPLFSKGKVYRILAAENAAKERLQKMNKEGVNFFNFGEKQCYENYLEYCARFSDYLNFCKTNNLDSSELGNQMNYYKKER